MGQFVSSTSGSRPPSYEDPKTSYTESPASDDGLLEQSREQECAKGETPLSRVKAKFKVSELMKDCPNLA